MTATRLSFNFMSAHQLVVELLTHTHLGIFTPLDTGLNIVVDDITAIVACHLSIYREDFNLISALRADFYFKRRGFQFVCSVAAS